MNYDNNRHNAHNEIDHIFQDLFPTRNMAERPEQAALCHRMLDAMLEGGIALCDAGTGIGKTYAYLVAGTVYSRFRAACGLERKPILVSTSSIALQTAARDEYLPLLSDVLTEDGMIVQPLRAVIRKGKSHYVCDMRLEQRLGQLDLQKKNWKAGAALLSLRGQLDMDEAAHLSGYDRERVCVPPDLRLRTRRRKLHISRFCLTAKARSFRCSSSPHKVMRLCGDPKMLPVSRLFGGL